MFNGSHPIGCAVLRVITDFSGDGSLSPGFFFFFFFLFLKTSVVLLKLWGVEDYSDLGTPCPRNLIIT